MKDKIKIRKAELKDAGTIAKLNTLMAKETENMELDSQTVVRGVKAVIKDPHKGFYLVAEMKGEIIGHLMVTNEWSDWRNANIWWFQSVYVLPPYRRKGIFRSMYSNIKDEADKQGVAGLRLYVESNNSRAQKTYEALGISKVLFIMEMFNLFAPSAAVLVTIAEPSVLKLQCWMEISRADKAS